MNITCPNCGFNRTVNEASLPQRAVMATCPKCSHRFKFREMPVPPRPQPTRSRPEPPAERHEEQPAPQSAEPIQPPTPPLQPAKPPRDEDLWKELEELDETDAEDESEDTASDEPVAPRLPAWEQATAAYPRAFVQTFLDMVSNPKLFFRAMPVGSGPVKPLLFFLIITQFVAITQAIWQLMGILPPSALTENLGHSVQAALALILYPFEATFFLFLDTVINHLFLRLFRADTKGFEGTFRAEAYSTAPMLLMAVPFIGLPMAMIGMTVYKFLGLRHVHGASAKQVLAVLILPVLLAVAVAVAMTILAGKV